MRRSLLAAVLLGCLSMSGTAQTPRDDVPPGLARPGRTEKGAYLGVAASAAPQALRQQLRLPKGVGLVVEAVAPDSPAAEAGLQQHDVLHKVDGQILVNPQQLAVLVRTFKPGDAVKLVVYRDGKPTELSAKLVERALPPLDEMRLGAFDPFLGPANGGPVLPDRPQAVRPPTSPRDGPEARPFPPGVLMNEDFTLAWDDGKVELNITVRGGRKHLVARDKAGKTLFDGPIDTEEQRRATPPDVRDRLPHVGPPGMFRTGPDGGGGKDSGSDGKSKATTQPAGTPG